MVSQFSRQTDSQPDLHYGRNYFARSGILMFDVNGKGACRAHGKAKRKTVGAPDISLTQKSEGFPDITATYCFPASS